MRGGFCFLFTGVVLWNQLILHPRGREGELGVEGTVYITENPALIAVC